VSTLTLGPRHRAAERTIAAAYAGEVEQPAVEVRNLQKRYGTVTAVAGLSLTATPGRVLAILGPNGAGKTTTVEMCEGYRRPDGGTVRVLGLDPVADARALRPRIGVMLQEGGGYPGAKTGEMLRLLAAYATHPLDPGELLERLGLSSAADTAYRRLSGGQKQRLSLAMAVVARPELVFLDEPTAGLDPQARHATWDVVRQLRTDGVTVVLTTHYMEEAERLADEVVVVDGGRAVAVGTPAELTRGGADGQLRFTAVPGLDLVQLAAALPAKVTVAEPRRGEYLVTVPGPVGPHLVAAVTAWCAEQDVLAEELRVQRRSLEDVFLELTGRGLR
jgi:ABC-2 type transport system ATP-binding protein